MKNVTRRGLLAAILCLACLFASFSVAAREANTLTIGMFAYRPVPILEPAWTPLAEYLQERLPGVLVDIRFLSQEEMADALQRDELDLMFTHPTHYVTLSTQSRFAGAVATLIALVDQQPVSQLGGVLIRRKERTDIQHWRDLQGRVVAITGKQYLGGYTAQAQMLAARGIPLDRIEFKELGSPHDKVIAAVFNRQADAGFISTGILESLLRAGDARVSELEVVEPVSHPGFPLQVSTALYPEWAMVALPHLDRDLSRRVSAALLALEPEHPVSRTAGIHGFTMPSDYEPVHQAMVSARVPPFDETPVVSWSEFIRTHVVASALGGLLSLCLVIAGVWLSHSHRRLRDAHARLARQNEQLALLHKGFEHSWSSIVITDANPETGYLVETANPAFCAMTGYSLDELRGHTLKRLQGPDTDPAVIEYLRQCLREGRYFDGTTINYRKDGKPYTVRWNISPVRDEQGKITHFVSMQQDLSARIDAERMRDLLASAFNATSDSVIITDTRHRILFANEALAELTHYPIEDVLGKTPALFRSGKHDANFYARLRGLLNSGKNFDATFINKRADGSLYYAAQSISPIFNDKGVITHYVSVSKDITAQVESEQKWRQEAVEDKLTGLYTRRYGEELVKKSALRAQALGTPLAVIVCDIDHFKCVNDSFGHAAGDRVLSSVAQSLRLAVRSADAVIRWGGEEFVILLDNCPQAAAVDLAERIRRQVEAQPDAEVGTVTLSLGLAMLRLDETIEQCIARADAALYQSKEGGRNRVSLA